MKAPVPSFGEKGELTSMHPLNKNEKLKRLIIKIIC